MKSYKVQAVHIHFEILCESMRDEWYALEDIDRNKYLEELTPSFGPMGPDERTVDEKYEEFFESLYANMVTSYYIESKNRTIEVIDTTAEVGGFGNFLVFHLKSLIKTSPGEKYYLIDIKPGHLYGTHYEISKDGKTLLVRPDGYSESLNAIRTDPGEKVQFEIPLKLYVRELISFAGQFILAMQSKHEIALVIYKGLIAEFKNLKHAFQENVWILEATSPSKDSVEE